MDAVVAPNRRRPTAQADEARPRVEAEGMSPWIELGAAAFCAGFVDAVMGGGGMVQLPALLALYPTLPPALLLGTNKLASSVGTTGAALQYARVSAPRWTTVAPVVIAAFLASLLGAYAVSRVPADPLRKALPFLLLALLLYTAVSDLGLVHEPRYGRHKEAVVGSGGAAVVGFYDGFFGPGAGTFYKLIFVRALGFDFLNAATPAKLANVASNVAAIAIFAANGLILWKVGAGMAAANFLGGQLGSRIALRYGNRLIRWAFVAVVGALVARTFRDAYLL